MNAEGESLRLRENFLEPETRCDTYIDSKMKAVWKVELDILEEIIRICKKYDLKYFMMAGSMLGAVRHHGIIPWDDDVDVAMPREDYDRFLKLAPSELKAPHYLMTVLTDPEWNTDYAQIRNSETAMISRYWVLEKKAHFNFGIMVDIYPMDGLPKSSVVRLFQRFARRCLLNINWCAFYRGGTECPWRAKAKPFIKPIFKLLGMSFFYRLRHALLCVQSLKNAKMCSLIGGFPPSETHFTWPKEWFDQLMEVDFEYLKVMIPARYDEILTKTYGDWHKLVRGGSQHESLIVDPWRSYKNIPPEEYME